VPPKPRADIRHIKFRGNDECHLDGRAAAIALKNVQLSNRKAEFCDVRQQPGHAVDSVGDRSGGLNTAMVSFALGGRAFGASHLRSVFRWNAKYVLFSSDSCY
jgi:hypothetical protein